MRPQAMFMAIALLAGCGGPAIYTVEDDPQMLEKPLAIDVDWLESHYSITLPARHRQALLDPNDPIHGACEFLLLDGPDVIVPIAKTNAHLRNEPIYEWPDYLFAFASHAFGDYYVYDTRSHQYQVIYIDPDLTMEENLVASPGDLRFNSFDEWYDYSLAQAAQRSASEDQNGG